MNQPYCSAKITIPSSAFSRLLLVWIGCLLIHTTRSQQTLPINQSHSVSPSNQWAWNAINLPSSLHFLNLKKSLKVAIIDDGFDIDNPLWASNIARNAKEIPGNNIDDDHNGKTDDYEGWDFGDNDEEVRPDPKYLKQESHGTKVLGIFWEVLQLVSDGDLSAIHILPIKAVSDQKMNNYLKEGYNGIEYAIEQKADIILCSWSGSFIAPEEKAIMAKAQAAGIMIIAAAGNFYYMQPQYPGAIPSVINVAATDRTGAKLKLSNYGSFVDISAPGDSLFTFSPYQKTAASYVSATSAATPVVAAVVAAIRSACPDLSPRDIERLIKNTASPLEDKNPLYAGNLGAGLLNVSGIREELEKTGLRYPMTTKDRLTKKEQGHLFRQPKAFIDLQTLATEQPVRIVPGGKYKNIKFFLQTSPPFATLSPTRATPHLRQETHLPDIRVSIFKEGLSRDTLLKKDRLKYPFIVTADSIYLFNTHPVAAAVAPPVGQYAAYHANSTNRPAPIQDAWWYYEVTTIDSSTLFCGNTITEITGAEGILEDGSGTLNYTGRNDCKWQLTVPEGKKIQLSFEEFDTEPKIDQVYIFNGTTTKDPILAIFSGHKIPPTVKSWGNTVLIWFLTSEENNFKGWKLHYQAVDK
ncbi:S8 family serine peptidase [Flavitalea flava]